jgi:hypothetical protein
MENNYDPYGAKQAVIMAEVGTLQDKHNDLVALFYEQKAEIATLRDCIVQILDMIEGK